MNQRRESNKPPTPRPEKLLTSAEKARVGEEWECPNCHRKMPRTTKGVSLDLGFVDKANGDINGSYDVFMIDDSLGYMCVECGATLLLESLKTKNA